MTIKVISTGLTLAAALMVSTTLDAQSLRQAKEPANLPPESYEGLQFVDNRGCVYVRSGFGGRVTWVPRVDRKRRQLCSKNYTPTFQEVQVATAEPKKEENPLGRIFGGKPKAEAEDTAVASAPAPRPDPKPAVDVPVAEPVIVAPDPAPAPAPVLAAPKVVEAEEPVKGEEVEVAAAEPEATKPRKTLREILGIQPSTKPSETVVAETGGAVASSIEPKPRPEPEPESAPEPEEVAIAEPKKERKPWFQKKEKPVEDQSGSVSAPAPKPALTPKPVEVVKPKPVPVPVETPVVKVEPKPEPKPAPKPEPKPEPKPAPKVAEAPALDDRLTLQKDVKKGIYVNVATLKTVDEAADLSIWFRRSGHSSVITPVSSGTLVLVGPFRSEGAARAAQVQANGRGHSGARIIKR